MEDLDRDTSPLYWLSTSCCFRGLETPEPYVPLEKKLDPVLGESVSDYCEEDHTLSINWLHKGRTLNVNRRLRYFPKVLSKTFRTYNSSSLHSVRRETDRRVGDIASTGD